MRLLLFLFLPAVIYAQQDSIHHVKDNMVRYENFYQDLNVKARSRELYNAIIQPAKSEQEIQDIIIRAEDNLIFESGKQGVKVDKFEMAVSVQAKIFDDLFESGKKHQDSEEIKVKGRRLKGKTQFDSRIEMHQLNPLIPWQSAILKSCESVGIIVEKNKIKKLTDHYYYLDTNTTLGNFFNLCEDEPFYNQPVLGGGTGFIISDNSMITARHVFVKPLSEYVIIFGYRLLYSNGIVEIFFPKDNIYIPIAIKNNFYGIDAVEFKVDRRLERPPLKLIESQSVKMGDEIYMIGHSCGLPLKVAVNASISDAESAQYFYTTLDSFMGNSGSPVFDSKTHSVIGVLVSGEVDFQFNGNCYYSPVCKLPECTGEKVVRIDAIKQQR